MAVETYHDNLAGMAIGLSRRIDCIHDKSEGFAADIFLSSLEQAYSHGRADCLQEVLDLKKPLLPHELKLIAQLLEEAADESARQPGNEFELPDTKRMREMLIDMVLWNDPRLAGRPDLLAKAIPDKSETEDFFLMRWLAHRVREALVEEEG